LDEFRKETTKSISIFFTKDVSNSEARLLSGRICDNWRSEPSVDINRVVNT
jgi:hypothetical protein